MMSSKVLSVVLISALLARYSLCSPLGIIGPAVRPENADYGDGGKSMAEVTFDAGQDTAGSFPSGLEGMLYYPPEQRYHRAVRHADGLFNTAYRKALGQLSARKYLHNLVAKRIGGGSSAELESFSKRHVDGVFTNSYSRYRKQMAVKKYLAAILGTSPEDLDLHQVLRGLDLGALPDADELERHAFLWEWLQQVPSQLPAL